jgi:predicted type IV restriction endonuclease
MYWVIVKEKRDGSNQRKILSTAGCRKPKEKVNHKGKAITKKKFKHNGMAITKRKL